MTTQQQMMTDFCKTHKITFTFTEVMPSKMRQKGYGIGARHFRCFIKRKGCRVGCTYSMGSALENDPKLEEFMHSVTLDARCVEGLSFQDYCNEMGENNDSIKAYRVYLACKKMAEKLRVLLGQTAYNELLQIEQE